MKRIVFDRPTKNVEGLLTELRKIGPVITVASDPRKTYVYLEKDSELDLKPFMKTWEDVPEIRVESMNAVDSDGIPIAVADGKDVHTLVIQKTTIEGEVIPDGTKIVVTSPQPVTITPGKFRLKDGLASITVGPSDKVGNVVLSVQDSSKKMKVVTSKIRFIGKPAPAPPPVPDAPSQPVAVKEKLEVALHGQVGEISPEGVKPTPSETIWQKLKRMLGI